MQHFIDSAEAVFSVKNGRFTEANPAAQRLFAPMPALPQPIVVFSAEFQTDGRASLARILDLQKTAFEKGLARAEWLFKKADGVFRADFWLAVFDKNLYAFVRPQKEAEAGAAPALRALQTVLPLAEIDPEGQILFFNDLFLKQTGLSRAQLRNATAQRFVPQWNELFAQKLQYGQTADADWTAAGTTTQGVCLPATDAQGKVEKVIFLFHNAPQPNEPANANAQIFALQNSLSEKSQAFEAYKKLMLNRIAILPGLLYQNVVGRELQLLFINDRIETMLGFPAQDFRGEKPALRLTDLIHPEDLPQAVETVATAVQQQRDFHITYRIRNSAGEYRWFSETGRPVFDEIRQKTVIDGFCFDITERRAEQIENARTMQIHLQVLNCLNEGVFGVNRRGVVTFMNTAGAALLGYRPEDLIGQNFQSAFQHTLADGSPHYLEDAPIYQTLQDGQTRKLTAEVFWKNNGDGFLVDYNVAPLTEDGQTVGAVVTFAEMALPTHLAPRLANRGAEPPADLVLSLSGNLLFAEARAESCLPAGWPQEAGQTMAAFALTVVHPEDLSVWRKAPNWNLGQKIRFRMADSVFRPFQFCGLNAQGGMAFQIATFEEVFKSEIENLKAALQYQNLALRQANRERVALENQLRQTQAQAALQQIYCEELTETSGAEGWTIDTENDLCQPFFPTQPNANPLTLQAFAQHFSDLSPAALAQPLAVETVYRSAIDGFEKNVGLKIHPLTPDAALLWALVAPSGVTENPVSASPAAFFNRLYTRISPIARAQNVPILESVSPRLPDSWALNENALEEVLTTFFAQILAARPTRSLTLQVDWTENETFRLNAGFQLEQPLDVSPALFAAFAQQNITVETLTEQGVCLTFPAR